MEAAFNNVGVTIKWVSSIPGNQRYLTVYVAKLHQHSFIDMHKPGFFRVCSVWFAYMKYKKAESR